MYKDTFRMSQVLSATLFGGEQFPMQNQEGALYTSWVMSLTYHTACPAHSTEPAKLWSEQPLTEVHSTWPERWIRLS